MALGLAVWAVEASRRPGQEDSLARVRGRLA